MGTSILKRYCKAGSAAAYNSLGYSYKAYELYQRSCHAGSDASCLEAAFMQWTGKGTRQNKKSAKKIAIAQQKALDVLVDDCDEGAGRECAVAGVVHGILGHGSEQRKYLEAGCNHGDLWACDEQRRGFGR